MPALHRRRALELLATGGLASVAGCFGGRRRRSGPDCEPRVGLRLRPTDDDAIAEGTHRPLADLQPLARAIVRTVRSTGPVTYDSARWLPPDTFGRTFPGARPFPREPFPITPPGDPHHRYVHLSDGYHRLAIERVRAAETTEFTLVGRTSPAIDEAARSGDTVALEDLPRHDRWAVLAFLRDDVDVAHDVEFGRVWDLGYLQDEHRASSLLVPEPVHDYVGVRDWFLEVVRNGADRGTRATYDVGLDHVGDSTDAFTEAVKQTDGVDLDEESLSPGERDVLETVTGTTAWACLGDTPTPGDDEVVWVDRDGTPDGADPADLEALLEAIGAARYAKHDGQWYAVDVTRWL